MSNFYNQVYFKSSQNMSEVPPASVDLIITSPPYFNIKDYSKDGYQNGKHSTSHNEDLGAMNSYEQYINGLLEVWKECERVLKPNGKLIINTPLMPMKKADYSTHYNRHIFNIDADIQCSIIKNMKNIYLFDVYIWNRTNPTKSLMFGSYPYPRNFYAQNTSEFITVYVKGGTPVPSPTQEIKDKSKLSEKEWVDFTQQIWNIPIPNKNDLAFGKHSAIMPEEIIRRSIRLFSFENDIVLDPFTGSGTTLKVAKELKRRYVGYELYENYKNVISLKIDSVNSLFEIPTSNKNNITPEPLTISCKIGNTEKGFVQYLPLNDLKKIIITDLQVFEKRKNIGSLLLEELEKYAQENEIQLIEIESVISQEAIRFFEKNGFEINTEIESLELVELEHTDLSVNVLMTPDKVLMTKYINKATEASIFETQTINEAHEN